MWDLIFSPIRNSEIKKNKFQLQKFLIWFIFSMLNKILKINCRIKLKIYPRYLIKNNLLQYQIFWIDSSQNCSFNRQFEEWLNCKIFNFLSFCLKNLLVFEENDKKCTFWYSRNFHLWEKESELEEEIRNNFVWFLLFINQKNFLFNWY
jgi:hypothetical protein